MGCELYRILEGLRAGGPEVVKVSYGASCGPYRLLEDLKAGDPEDVGLDASPIEYPRN